MGSASNDKRALANDPLIQDGQKMVPSITRAFRKDQTMYVYFEVYDPSPDEQKAPDVTADVELMRGARKVYTSAPAGSEEAGRGPSRRGALPVPDPAGQDSRGPVHHPGQYLRHDRQEVRNPAQRDLRAAGRGSRRGAGRSAPAAPNQ